MSLKPVFLTLEQLFMPFLTWMLNHFCIPHEAYLLLFLFHLIFLFELTAFPILGSLISRFDSWSSTSSPPLSPSSLISELLLFTFSFQNQVLDLPSVSLVNEFIVIYFKLYQVEDYASLNFSLFQRQNSCSPCKFQLCEMALRWYNNGARIVNIPLNV